MKENNKKTEKKSKENQSKNNTPSNGKEVVKIKDKNHKIGEITKKWLSRTPLTILLIVIIIAAYILINYGVEKANITDIDLTPEKIYTLSDTSKQIIDTIDKDVTITLINMDTVESVKDFAYKYNKENASIKIEEVNDINSRPDLVNKYNLTANSCLMIIQCGEKEKQLVTSDFYTWDYTTGAQKDVTEEAITNALLDVTVEEKPKIYYLTGHNQYSIDQMYYLTQDLEDEANEVEELDLLARTEVPDDCSVLMITTLKEDITEPERDALIKYIKKGGKIILFTNPNVNNIKLTNFQKVLDEYGVSISEGIILEQDPNKMLSSSPYNILVTVSPSTSITKETNMNMNACFMTAGKREVKDSEELEKLGVEVENLATTSSEALYRTDLTNESTTKTSQDEDAANAVVGALLTKKIDDNTSSKLIVYSNNMFITNLPLQVNSQYYLYALDLYNNEDLAMNSISYLAGREDTITIRKDTETSTYTVTEQQGKIILAIIFAVPAAIVVAGLIVWQVRRRKK